ncbi:uncharacterized protein LTR77_000940 [Saxophila tyrrhenica]|uniref:Heterokaryon incompatibility domain-containing protein n=1 Tax=Saxophila tyrrhenica TaxID=1690608 RepID=A0AAV9PQP6_9PEZI|nr:hypothetical protein LTR77_000940 [Saxophila tyrrhenica]
MPAYETVSYCWGDSTVCSVICLDGALVDCPASAAPALTALRFPDSNRTLWIDAICINRSNPEEKSQQVVLMSEVYRGTRQNLVYLGEGDDSIGPAREAIELVLRDIRRETRDLETMLDHLYDENEVFWYSSTGLDVTFDTQALLPFYSGP